MSHLWPLILWSGKGGCCCPCFLYCTWMWKSQNRTNPFKYRSSFHRLACVGFKERGKKEKNALKARHSVCNKQKTMSATENTCTVESSRESTPSASDLMKAVTSDSMYRNQVLLRTRTTKRLLSFVEVHTFIEFCWLTCRNSLHNWVCDFL